MSFSTDVKSELLEQTKTGCCALSLLSALVHTGGSINISKEGLYVEIATETEKLAKLCVFLFNSVSATEAVIRQSDKSSLKKHSLYTVSTSPFRSEQMLEELGIITLDEENHRQINGGIDPYIVEQNCCKISYITGAFLCCGSICAPLKNNTGYGCRFTFSNEEICADFKKLLEALGLHSNISIRKDNYIVYIKESESISDFLVLTGAQKSALRLREIMLSREVKNNANRQTNCIVANIDKSVIAGLKQIEAINKIINTAGLSSLPLSLKQVAEMRIKHPEATLEAIADMCGGLTKSGINHRMRKIIEIAGNINNKE